VVIEFKGRLSGKNENERSAQEHDWALSELTQINAAKPDSMIIEHQRAPNPGAAKGKRLWHEIYASWRFF